ncbi:hypothetical protein ASPVEDRAFT_590403 [Aspergillus versicolor CBS 583.65]|uniref:Uncharacterized protein n=1 Tax=Aspergillus versicolor CBS 583.65 TaxID=1036611 RepID=A0A1L9PH04_ASPVE|nr:uncharacterized protein ASPVEDRAFT_590403 [Aspergillus versicolor CBS 583.65]OJJ00791.1 hypothetical protein ASPVEDRAFT_590403 [Aspergillus versicolor CBS 583.65]
MSPSSQAMVHQRTAQGESGIRPMLVEPRTLSHLCNQQTLINNSWRGPRSLQISSSKLTEKYCTCNRKPRYFPTSYFSVSAGHKASCPLYVNGHQTIGISARYTFCNRLIGMSVHVMMTLTRGAGALAISPALQFHSVVPDDSPAFSLLRNLDSAKSCPDSLRILESIQWNILEMFHNRKAAPTDRLADGSTLLHVLLRSGSCLPDSDYLYVLRDFGYSLIEAGVPVAEKTLNGDSAADEILSKISLLRPKGWMPNPAGQLLQRLFMSGSELRSLTEVPNHYYHYIPVSGLTAFWYSKATIVRSLCLQNMLGDIELSPLEMAIVTKSEASLRECLPRTNIRISTSTPYIPEFGTLLALCLGWIPGMLLVFESLAPDAQSISHCFAIACVRGDVDCALLLLGHNPDITLGALQCAVFCGDTAVLKTAISILAAQRLELQEMALHQLPAEHIRTLELPKGGLPDTTAFAVHHALVQYEIKMLPCGCPGQSSVYSAIGEDLAAAELLYTAGFTDLNQRGEVGNTAITDMSSYCESLISFITMADWMICRGADLYIPSRHGYLAIFYVASELGTQLYRASRKCHSKACRHDLTSSCELETILSTHVAGARLLSTMLSDDTRDDCLCACSGRGCSPLTQLLKAYYRPNRLWVIGHLQEIVYSTSNTHSWNTTVSAIVRYLTFEALEITHTCHSASVFGVRHPDPEECREIREEESTMIVQLDELMVEFDQKYDELGVGIRKFLEGYWHTRMGEVLQGHDIDPDEAMKLREIGVVLDDVSSDDG